MEEAPPRDGTFQLVPSPTPGVFDFKVATHYGTPKPTSAIAAGTAYSAITNDQIPSPPYKGGSWDTYVAAQSEPAGTRIFWQHFVASLPTTPIVADGMDVPIWGKTREHRFLDLITNTRPDRGDMFSTRSTTLPLDLVAGGTWDWVSFGAIELASVRPVLMIKEEDLKQGLCAVTITTVANSTVGWNETALDEETGQLKTVSTLHTLSATAPAGSATGADGRFTTVTRQGHNHWLSLTDAASMLPTSRDAALTWDTTGSIYWPAVLESYTFHDVIDETRTRLNRLLTYNLRDPYSGDVRVTVRQWRSATAETITPSPSMVPSGIKVDGNILSFSIPECLHADFNYDEQELVFIDGLEYVYNPATFQYEPITLEVFTFNFSATNVEDWPETIVRHQQKFRNGVYDHFEETFHRPDNYAASQQTVTTRPWTEQDGYFYDIELATT